MPEFSGPALRQRREAAGFSRERLAVAAGVSYPAVVGYELGNARPPADKVARLADALNVPIGDLFTDDNVSAA